VGVKLWMPAMGHGSSPVNVAHAVDQGGANVPGVFKATNVYFVMPGDWDVHVQLKNGSKVVEETVEKVTI
ncbi:MAG: FixH family protein, partial [Deltaproteobacteria bacterium]|nr:FixH family protein [Deltaproteobacteria bacterium]